MRLRLTTEPFKFARRPVLYQGGTCPIGLEV